MSLKNKVTIVTGASSGIGEAIAVWFAKEGAKVVIVGRNVTNLNKVAERCSQVGEKPLVIAADVTKIDEALNIIQKTLEVYGRLDILINNAGVWRASPVEEQNFETFDEVINTNFKAVVVLTNAAVPHLIKTKGNIVNVSSSLGVKVLPGYSIYCASKAAVNHFTRVTAAELAGKGVRVNAITPGPVETNLFNEDKNISWSLLRSLTALQKMAKPNDIAELVAYLASDRASSVTGSDFLIDCGAMVKQ